MTSYINLNSLPADWGSFLIASGVQYSLYKLDILQSVPIAIISSDDLESSSSSTILGSISCRVISGSNSLMALNPSNPETPFLIMSKHDFKNACHWLEPIILGDGSICAKTCSGFSTLLALALVLLVFLSIDDI